MGQQRRAGSGEEGGGPQHSINFITAHDGFTLSDLVALQQEAQRGERRGQQVRAGHHKSQDLSPPAQMCSAMDEFQSMICSSHSYAP